MDNSPFLTELKSTLKRIADGSLVDNYSEDGMQLEAWEAFNGLWRRNQDQDQDHLTKYQRCIFQEFWYLLENYDGNPALEGKDGYETDWDVIKNKATMFGQMLSNVHADQNSEPYKDWLDQNYPRHPGNSKGAEVISIDYVLNTWPRYRDWLVLHKETWQPFHDWFSNIDRTNIWVDFVLEAHDEQGSGPGMRSSTGQTVVLKPAIIS